MTPKKILIVEDCPDVLELLAEALTLLGWETILAENGWEMRDKLESETPNVIFLNMRSPVMHGIKLAASAKSTSCLQKYSDSCRESAFPRAQPGALSGARL